MKISGKGPIMAYSLDDNSLSDNDVGYRSYPSIHPVFNAFVKRMETPSIGEPAHTDAREFEDGKLMLGKLTPLNDANWDNRMSRVGKEKLTEIMRGSRLIGMVNWTMLPHMSRVWA